VPDDPSNLEFEGEEATYYIEVDGHNVMQAFSYWQLEERSHNRSFEIVSKR
jgi:hypothetical protein